MATACDQRDPVAADPQDRPIAVRGLDDRGEQVRGADEARDERGPRALVDLGRRADLLDSPSLKTAIRSLMVSASSWSCVTYRNVIPTDSWMCLSSICMSWCEASDRARRAARPSSKHARPVDERARERDALPLAPRELTRLASPEVLRAAPSRCASPARRLPLAARDALDPQAVLDVLLHRHVREQRVVLEDGVHVAVVRRSNRSRRRRRSSTRPALGTIEARDHPQARRLARPDGPSIEKNSPRTTRGRRRRPP